MVMAYRGRTRRVLTTLGFLTSAALAAATGLSLLGRLDYHRRFGQTNIVLSIGRAQAVVFWFDFPFGDIRWPGWHPEGWTFNLNTQESPIAIPSFASRGFSFPLWVAFIIVGVPTASLCWRKTRHCAGCGHDLAGITTDVCPECGKSFLQAHDRPSRP